MSKAEDLETEAEELRSTISMLSEQEKILAEELSFKLLSIGNQLEVLKEGKRQI